MALTYKEGTSQRELTLDEIGVIANKMLTHLEGLSKPQIETVFEWMKNSVNPNYLYFHQDLKTSEINDKAL